jgi:hypothetical protein
MASKLAFWRKGGRILTGLVVLCFFLPFFGVSCQGFDVVTITGADMVYGGKPGGLIADSPKLKDSDDSGMGGGKLPSVDVEPLAIIALACAVIAFGLAWVKSRGALTGVMVVAIAGVGALAGLYIKVKGNLDDAAKSELKKEKGADGDIGSKIMNDMNLDVGGRMGLWATAFGFAATAVWCGMALKEKEGIGGVGVAGGPPPGGYPPAGYPPQGGGYPPQGGGYPPQGGGYPPQGGGYPPQQG